MDNASEKTKTRKFVVTCLCTAVSKSTIDVPANFSEEEAMSYAEKNMHKIPIGELEYVEGSDVIDYGSCGFYNELDNN